MDPAEALVRGVTYLKWWRDGTIAPNATPPDDIVDVITTLEQDISQHAGAELRDPPETRPKRPGIGTAILMLVALEWTTNPSATDRALLLGLSRPDINTQVGDLAGHLAGSLLFVWLIFRVARNSRANQ